jgi:hypothetical protein
MTTSVPTEASAAWARIHTWLSEANLVDTGDIAVLAGSLAAGLGNRASDIDVYVVRADAPGDLEGQQFFVDGWRVDCHDLTATQLATAVDTVTAQVAGGRPVADDLATLVYRVTHGLPLTPVEVPDELRRRGQLAVRDTVVATGRRRIAQLWWSLAVAVALDDYDTYLTAAADLVEAALYGALARAGSRYPNPKWNWEKAAQLPDPEQVLEPVRGLHRLIATAWPRLPEPAGVSAILDPLGVGVPLAVPRIYPRRADGLRCYSLAGMRYLVLDGQTIGASPAAAHLLALADGTRDIGQILDAVHVAFGGSQARLDEDGRHALRHLAMLQIVTLDPAAGTATEFPPGTGGLFEPAVTMLGPVDEFLRHKLGIWTSWVDYLSRRDDLAGAVPAGQVGAAVTATREAVRLLARIHLYHHRLVPGPGSGQELSLVRHHLGEESALAREMAELVRLTPAAGVRIEPLIDRLDALEAWLMDDIGLVLEGSLREEEGHGRLFVHLRELLTMAEHVGVDLAVSQLMLDKSRRYGQ